MDNDQATIDRFDSSGELNRTWYFERFSSLNSDELNSGEEFFNRSKIFTHLDKNLNRNIAASLVDSRLEAQESLNSDSSVFSNLFESKEFSSSNYELNSNSSKYTTADNELFSTILPSSSVNASSFHNSTNLPIQLIDEVSAQDGTFLSQLFVTNLPSIQSLINDDQMYLVLNSSNASNLIDSTFTNSTLLQTFDKSFNNSSLDANLQPDYNWTYIIVVFLIIFGVLGNCLVCLAICLERRLQNATNYFLLSLAICDLLVSLIVMPFLMLFDFYGYWPFGTTLCNFWVTCDVLLCTSSIIHLLFISVTRYIGIRHPLTARRVPLLASRKAAIFKIFVAWLLAAIISSPITILATIDTINIQPEEGVCAINNRLFFTLGSIVSFFLPMLIMVNTYVLTIRLLKRKAKLCQENASLQQSNDTPKPSIQCKVLVHDKKKRDSKSSISSDYSTGLGTTTFKESDYATQHTQSKPTDSLPTNNYLSAVHKSQLTEQTNHKRNFSAYSSFSMFSWTRQSKTRFRSAKDKNSTGQSQSTNKSAYENNRNSQTIKNNSKRTKKQRTQDCEIRRFQDIRFLFSKNQKMHKKQGKRNNHRQDVEVKLDEQIDEKSDEKSPNDQTCVLEARNCDKKKAKRGKIEGQDQFRMRKSNTFSNLETVKDQQKINVEINNNLTDEPDKRKQLDKSNLKINNPSLALLSPGTIMHQSRRLSAHSEIRETGTSPLTPTTSSNPMNSIQPVLVRTLGSSQVLTEQKATKVLGVVFFSFVFCWAPFFVHNFLAGVSPDLVAGVPKSVVSLLQWLGYVSSTLNPIIYTIFNNHFRRTFRKLLFCQNVRVSRSKLKNSSPRLTSRMVSFRNSSLSRNQSSILKKKPLTSFPSNRPRTESLTTIEKTASFTHSPRNQSHSNEKINELNEDEVKKIELKLK